MTSRLTLGGAKVPVVSSAQPSSVGAYVNHRDGGARLKLSNQF